MYKDFVLLLQNDRMLSSSELKRKVCLQLVYQHVFQYFPYLYYMLTMTVLH